MLSLCNTVLLKHHQFINKNENEGKVNFHKSYIFHLLLHVNDTIPPLECDPCRFKDKITHEE